MRRYGQSLELIILVPVLVLLVLSGAGVYFLILNSVQEFADSTIRQSFQSMVDGIHSIADRKVDELNRTGRAANERIVRVRQVSALIEIEDFARKNDVGVVIYSEHKSDAILVAGLPTAATSVVTKTTNLRNSEISLSTGDRYYADSSTFAPWSWHITLLKDRSAYNAVLSKARFFYMASGIALLVISVFLIVYLRRMIARPIHLIVSRIREREMPEYRGIREFEFFFIYGLGMVDRGFDRYTMINAIPKAYPFMGVPLAAAFACVQLVLVAIHDFFSPDGVSAAESAGI